MRRMLLVAAAVVGAALFAPDAANAQFGPRYGGWSGGFGYSPGFGYGSSFYGGSPWYRGHYDFRPGPFHGYRYVPPHIDYHIGRWSYAVDPWTGFVSPFPHRHRHRHSSDRPASRAASASGPVMPGPPPGPTGSRHVLPFRCNGWRGGSV